MLEFVVWPVMLCQSQASHPGKETTLRISNTLGTFEHSPPVLLQEALTDTGSKICYHCFSTFWNSGPFQTLDQDSMSLGTFEYVVLCNHRSRLSWNFYLCPQTVGKMGLCNLSQTRNLSLTIYPCGKTSLFCQLKLKNCLFTGQQKETWVFLETMSES